jgi:isocitrate dehydrogenase
MFEPAHGSALGIAGTGTANPAAAILADALMLRHLGFAAEAGAVESAVAGAMQAGECTADARRQLGHPGGRGRHRAAPRVRSRPANHGHNAVADGCWYRRT